MDGAFRSYGEPYARILRNDNCSRAQSAAQSRRGLNLGRWPRSQRAEIFALPARSARTLLPRGARSLRELTEAAGLHRVLSWGR